MDEELLEETLSFKILFQGKNVRLHNKILHSF